MPEVPSTNTPAIASGVGNAGDVWFVGTAGATPIDGDSEWNVGDLLVFDPVSVTWKAIPAGSLVAPASPTVAGIIKTAQHPDLVAGTALDLAVTPASLFNSGGNVLWLYGKNVQDPADSLNYWRANGTGIGFYSTEGIGGLSISGLSAGILLVGTGGGLASLDAGNSDGWTSGKLINVGNLWDDPEGAGVLIHPEGSIEVQGPNVYSAQGNQVVTAKDLRVNATGGMRYTASTDGTNVFAVGTDGVFDAVWVGVPTAGTFLNFVNTSGGRNGVAITGGMVRIVYDNAEVGSSIAVPTTPSVYRLKDDGTTYSLSVNGVGVSSQGSDLKAAFSRPDGWITPFTGECRLRRFTNFALTTDEAEGAAKGESRGRLAYRGESEKNILPWVDTGGYDGAATFSSADGTTFTYVTGTPGNFFPIQAVGAGGVPIQVEAGAPIRVTGNMAGTTGLNLCVFEGGNLNLPAFVAGVTPGAIAQEFVAPVAGIVGFYNPSGNTASVTASALSVDLLGTVASYEPQNCTSLNRWLDSSLNNYHLLPVGGAKALNPQVPHWREFAGAFNLATLAEDTPQGVTATRQVNPGTLRLSFASYMTAAGKRVRVTGGLDVYTGIQGTINSIAEANYTDLWCRKVSDGTDFNEAVNYTGAHFE
jgi:hypothetical protein